MALVHMNSDNFNISRRSFQVFPLSGKAGIFDSVKKKGIMCLVVSEFYGEYKRKACFMRQSGKCVGRWYLWLG